MLERNSIDTSPLHHPDIVRHLLTFLQANPADMVRAGQACRLFHQQSKALLSADPVFIIQGIKAMKREMAVVEQALQEAKTNHVFPATICDIPDTIEFDDASIMALQNLASYRMMVLTSYKFAKDAALCLAPAAFALGLFISLFDSKGFAKELIFLAVFIALALLLLDKYVINDNTQRDHFLPTSDDLLPSASYEALYRRYQNLYNLCEQWLNLDGKLKNEYITLQHEIVDVSVKDHLYYLWRAPHPLSDATSKRIHAEVTNRLFAP
jgi:hypothetical protein